MDDGVGDRSTRGRADPGQTAPGGTSEQRLDHAELLIGATNTELDEVRRRLALLESNIQNVGGNLQELVRAEVTQQLKHVGLLDIVKDEVMMQTKPVTEQMEKLNLDIENMMKQAEKTVKDEMGRLFDSDQMLKNAVDHVAKCTEGELERIKSVAEVEIGDMKKKV